MKQRVDSSQTRLLFPRVSNLSAPVLPAWRSTGKQMILHLPSFSVVNKDIWRQPQIYVLLFFSRPNLFNAVLCLVAQSCPTLGNPKDCSPPGSSVHGDSPGKNAGVGCHALLQLIQQLSSNLFFQYLCSQLVVIKYLLTFTSSRIFCFLSK